MRVAILRTALAGDLRRDHPIPAHIHDTDTLLVHDGDLISCGSISLDWACGWDTGAIIEHLAGSQGDPHNRPTIPVPAAGISGLLVTGSLRVSGALVNADSDSGAALIVRGDLTAQQASCGGSYIHIGGDVRIDDVLYAHYNDGELRIDGVLVAKALINDDHVVSISGDSQRQSQTKLQIIDLRKLGEADADEDEHVPKVLKKVIGNSPLTLASVLAALRECRSTASLGKPQTPYEWRDVIWTNPVAVRQLPKPLRTEEMYLMLLAGDCKLREPEIHELVSHIPSGMLTERVRMAAFLLSPKSLLRLPPQFDLHREYARCLAALTNSESYIGEIPAHFLPNDLQ
jgi:hypothetical protein